MDCDGKLVFDSGHKPTPLTNAERNDLAAITKHPGMEVLIGKILEQHARQQLERIHKIPLDDAARVTKLDAICSVAQAMRLTTEIAKMELAHNWKTLEDAENARREKGKKNEKGKSQ
jgi:hypothetical protein